MLMATLIYFLIPSFVAIALLFIGLYIELRTEKSLNKTDIISISLSISPLIFLLIIMFIQSSPQIWNDVTSTRAFALGVSAVMISPYIILSIIYMKLMEKKIDKSKKGTKDNLEL